MDVQIIIMHLGHHLFQMHRPQSLFLTNKVVLTMQNKIFVRTYRRGTHSKIMLQTESIRLMHLFATFGDKACTCRNPCAFSFKLLSQIKVATLASGGITKGHDSVEATLPKLFHSKLLYVADKNNKCKYLIDAGAAVSVLPKSCANRISDADCLPLVAANNYGNSKRVVDVGLKRDYPWTFIVADVQQPIIGADFFIHYNLLVDLRSRCLRDIRTDLAIPASLSLIRPLSLNRVDTVHNEYTKLLGQFPELTRPTTKGETVKHGITHKIVTKGHPVFARPRRLAPDKLVTAKREFDDMIKLGVIESATVNGF